MYSHNSYNLMIYKKKVEVTYVSRNFHLIVISMRTYEYVKTVINRNNQVRQLKQSSNLAILDRDLSDSL